jgi:thioredoxin-like negative regulator of GroEL
MVAKNPNDPDAHFQLALAFWDAHQQRSALEELTQAANLAGKDNRDFFRKAADKFKSREAWGAAASMYLHLLQTYPNDNAPEDVMNDFSEAVYKSADQADTTLFLFFDRIDRVNKPLGLVARGRRSLFAGAIDDANIQMEGALKINPDFPEASLLKSEIAIKTNHPDIAKPILLTLADNSGAPDWIRAMAGDFLKTIP